MGYMVIVGQQDHHINLSNFVVKLERQSNCVNYVLFQKITVPIMLVKMP